LAAGGWALDEAHMTECWIQVQAFPASLYDAAATLLNGRSQFLPRAAEWRQACLDAQDAEERAAREARDAEWARESERPELFHCPTCHDTGFAPTTCTASDWCTVCRRMRAHPYDHPAVAPCACRATNPVYLERRAKQQRAGGDPGRREARDVEGRVRRGAKDWQQVGAESAA
jgi:hypothetical protein